MRFSGKSNSLSIGKETTWGTPVATTALVPNTKHDPGMEMEMVDSATLTGSRASAGSLLVAKSGKLSIPFELNLETVGYLLKALLGTEVVTGAGPYTHTFTMSNGALPSWTFLSGIGGYELKNLFGALCKSLSFDIAQKAIVTGAAEFLYKDESSAAISLVPANVAIATGVHTYPVALSSPWVTDQKVRFFPQDATSTLPGGISEGVDYYVHTPTTTTFKIAATPGGAAIATFSAVPTGNYEVVRMEANTVPANRILSFKDSNAATAVKINAVNFGELLTASLAFDNNLSADDYRLGTAGTLGSVTTGAFDATGKLKVNFNGPSKILRDKLVTNVSVALQLELWEDATQVLRINFPAVYLKGGNVTADDGGTTQDFDFVATGSLATSPVTVTLINNHSGAY